MVPAQSPHEHDRVEANEHDRRHRVAPQQARAAPYERDRRQAGGDEDQLEPPEGGGHPERHHGERQQREQRPVGAQQLMPVADRVAGIAVGLQYGDGGVGVQVVHDLHAPVVDVVEDVGQRHGRREQKEAVHEHDRGDHRAGRQRGCVPKRQQVGHVHSHDRPAEQPPEHGGVARESRPGAAERTGHPARKEARVRGRRQDARPVRRHHHDEQAARDDRQQADSAQPLRAACADQRAGAPAAKASPSRRRRAADGRVPEREGSSVAGHD